MKISHKLLIMFSAVILIEGMIALFSVRTNSAIDENVAQLLAITKHELHANTTLKLSLQEIQNAAHDLVDRHTAWVESGKPEHLRLQVEADRKTILTNLDNVARQIADRKEDSEKDSQSEAGDDAASADLEAEEYGILENIEAEFAVYRDHIDQYMALVAADPEKAEEILYNDVQPHYKAEILPLIDELELQGAGELNAKSSRIQNDISHMNSVTLSLMLTALAVALVFGFYANRAISRPLVKLTKAAEKIGKGKLETEIDIKSDDEIGELACTLQAMAKELKTTTFSREYVDNIISNMAGCLIVASRDGTIGRINHATLSMLGHDESEVVGKPLGMLFSNTGQPAVMTDEELKEIASLNNSEKTFIAKDGREISVSCSGSIITGSGGEIESIILVAQDITESKLAADHLREAKEAAEEASQAKSEFLANMSHEIRTPMNGIMGMTELMLETPLDSEQREYMTMAKVSAESLLGVINDILDFSKIEAGKLAFDPVDFNLRDRLGDTMKTLAFRAHQKGLELAFYVEPDVPDALVGDVTRIHQVVTNLVGNAIKFTEQGEVVVHVRKESVAGDGVHLHFSVTDTGIGIPVEKQKKIFEPFTQADGSTTRKYGGTGLGLSICSQLVSLMGGKLWMESPAILNRAEQEAPGSIFHFTIHLGMQETAISETVSLELEDLKGMRVLVVDDNLTNRRILESNLKNWGMIPSLASGGFEALRFMSQAVTFGEPFSLVLLDAQMPGMDGFTVAMRIKQIPEFSGSTVMMLSSSDQHNDAARCREMGIKVYMIKPIKQSELLDAILRTLGSQARECPVPAATPRPSPRSNARRLRILVAEDNKINQKIVIRILEKQGHFVAVASDGKQAIEMADNEQFDLVLMDVQMPNMNGYEATATIREKERITGTRMPIIALTAYAMKGDQEWCLQAGMDDYVSKPVRAEQLLRIIENLFPDDPSRSLPDPCEESIFAERIDQH